MLSGLTRHHPKSSGSIGSSERFSRVMNVKRANHMRGVVPNRIIYDTIAVQYDP